MLIFLIQSEKHCGGLQRTMGSLFYPLNTHLLVSTIPWTPYKWVWIPQTRSPNIQISAIAVIDDGCGSKMQSLMVFTTIGPRFDLTFQAPGRALSLTIASTNCIKITVIQCALELLFFVLYLLTGAQPLIWLLMLTRVGNITKIWCCISNWTIVPTESSEFLNWCANHSSYMVLTETWYLTMWLGGV